ncbi:ferrous iron transport protein B [Flavobacteriaceae bacterium]|uniref:ferrous iron transport protein B n=1 Tax=Candidatus Arcticimaribacter forsetii TaxID=2820661 RepID=UPI0020778506|nr:ferrous iron transport protein B [Candidatus Arcticimaribacter forsetii]MDA8698588.1 ferrous iron transport protein B [Flavobacteriaceae bacterium]MDB2326241.1 ferrous iron transport protein B [Flavobacteriaceae bacterium]MDB2329061.1 ferrous iron transport protein B [Flavobacteriaceae bacterium]MDB2345387.1 ferrous iron transport protein B [Flavobacteriaceae bacterium]
MSKTINVALIGNPNTGKTSVFNAITGLNQKVGNYPGITVEKKQGICRLDRTTKAHIIDLPGTYSLNASSMDESVVIELLLNKNDKDYPDVAVVVSDIENLKRNLLLFTQIKDLEIPTLLVINMSDRMKSKGISIDIPLLEEKLKTRICLISTRENKGIDHLKSILLDYRLLSNAKCTNIKQIDEAYFEKLEKVFPDQSLYKLWLVITQDVNFAKLDRKKVEDATEYKTQSISNLKRLQQKETIKRYQYINQSLKETYKVDQSKATDYRSRLDRILIHRFWGYIIFFMILLTIFQVIFDWSSVPMDFIDESFSNLSEITKQTLPTGLFTNLLAEGIISGLGGIVIFIPQIAFLFLFISVLEETGYMSRVVFLMDRGLRKYGLSGKSVIPLISGTACAIPAVMATRNIENWKERLITILVTPFTTCSARLPVYLILISLVIPEGSFLGMGYQGLTLMGLYLLGFIMALLSAALLNKLLKIQSKTYFVVEMPNYKLPLIKNVAITVFEKTKSFVVEAGRIILAISILLWLMASFGPGEDFNNAEEIVTNQPASQNYTPQELETEIASYKLEHSFIGILGKSIEPAIAPLGFDWKIGIALISSFAAREVFVGTLATIYSVGNEQEETLKNRMKSERRPNGELLFNLPTGVSLMLFYAFALQCMSTLAIVKKETNSWKWPMVQLFSMTLIAYLSALLVYQILV